MTDPATAEETRKTIEQSLRHYCELDPYAMFAVWKALCAL
jgi:hypothetical protein